MGCCGSSERPDSTEKDKKQFQDDVSTNDLKQKNNNIGFKNKVLPLQDDNPSSPLPDCKLNILFIYLFIGMILRRTSNH